MQGLEQQPKGGLGKGFLAEESPELLEQMPPEVQEDFKKALGMSMMAFYNEKFLPKAVKMVKAAPTPAAGIGRVAATIGARIVQSARQSGQDVAGEAMLLAGFDLVREIADYLEEKEQIPASQELIEDAFLAAADNFKAAMKGDLPMPKTGVPSYDEIVQAAGGEQAIRSITQRMQTAQLPKEMRQMAQEPQTGLGMAPEGMK